MGVHMSMTSDAQARNRAVVPFTYRAHDDALIHLRQRLGNAQWPEKETGEARKQGPLPTTLQRLAFWRRSRCPTCLRRNRGAGFEPCAARDHQPKAVQ
jgi:hypothetical protein